MIIQCNTTFRKRLFSATSATLAFTLAAACGAAQDETQPAIEESEAQAESADPAMDYEFDESLTPDFDEAVDTDVEPGVYTDDPGLPEAAPLDDDTELDTDIGPMGEPAAEEDYTVDADSDDMMDADTDGEMAIEADTVTEEDEDQTY